MRTLKEKELGLRSKPKRRRARLRLAGDWKEERAQAAVRRV